MENNENVINQEEIVQEEKKAIVSLEYDQAIEDTKAINKFIINIDFGVSKLILFIVCLLIGILGLFVMKDVLFIRILSWFLCIVSPVGLFCIIVVKISSNANLKKLKNPSHIKLDFCDDKIRYIETSVETLIKQTFEYEDIVKIYTHDKWVLFRTKTNYIMIQANDKKDTIVEFVKTKKDKIKVCNK